MTVSTEVSSETYTGNGVTTVFPFRFKILNADDLVVLYRNNNDVQQNLVLNTDYTISGVGSKNGGSITLTTPAPDGWTLYMERYVDIVQDTDIRNQGNFYPEVHEDAFDYLTMIDQQQQLGIDRAVKVPPGSDTNPDELIDELKRDAERAEAARDKSEEIAEKFGDVDRAITEAQAARDDAQEFRDDAQDAADRAEAAASSAVVAAGVYENVAAAQEAANAGKIPVNSLVSIIMEDNKRFVGIYKNVNGTIVPFTDSSGAHVTYPSGQYVDEIGTSLEALDQRTAGVYTIDEQDGRTIFADKRGRMAMEILSNGDKTLYGKTQAYDLAVNESVTLSDSVMLPSDDSAYDFGAMGANQRVAFGVRKGGRVVELHGVPMTTQRGALPNDGMTTGDSINEFGLAFSGPNATGFSYAPCVNAQCWSAWAMLQTGAQYKYSGMEAKGGYTAAQILTTRIPKIIAAKPTFCVVMVGRNDVVQRLDFENETKPAMLQIFRQLRYAGIIPVICTMSAQSNNTDEQNVLRYKINALCRAYAAKYGLPLVDLHAATTDPTTGEWYAGYNQTKPDGTLDPSHPTPLGAKVMGEALAEVLNKWLSPTTPRKAASISTPEASDNKLPNPLFVEHSGGVPSGWVSDTVHDVSVTTDPAVVGNVYRQAGTDTEISASHITLSVTPGVRYGLGFMVKITANPSSWVSCYAVGGTSIADTDDTVYLGGLRSWKLSSDWGYFYFEFTVPDGETSMTIVTKAQNGTLELAQMGVFELENTDGV
ncbi:GDSL-type esterase/lipase family protein [Serratia rubidaea]|uniref:SGNH/GDSL hydrolase family protein n=1 Tax=Serratia rubidaea TaxID=61652 RepID=UPI003FA37D54